MAEMVNHPSHYNIPGRKECLDEMIDIYGIKATEKFCRMNAYKYHYRMGLKDGNSKEQDVAKAEWYENKADELKTVEKKIRKANVTNKALKIIYCAAYVPYICMVVRYAKLGDVTGAMLWLCFITMFIMQTCRQIVRKKR